MSQKALYCQEILQNIPFVIPFEKRVMLFHEYINNEKRQFQNWRPSREVAIRRDHVFEDGYAGLNPLGSGLKNLISITFIDIHGIAEAGIDGGGVFKEFLTNCLAEAFSPHLGLFSSTPEQLLYPSPTDYASQDEQLSYFEFLGRIIGKSIYENVLIDSAFAGFFLKKWIGSNSYFDDLPSLDREMYQGLLFLKNYEGDVEKDLSLNFTVTDESFGKSKTINLIPNGSQTLVTRSNRIKYVMLVANYKLNVCISKQCAAFFRGLSDLINPKWLKMFNQIEMQILLGGNPVPIDVDNFYKFTTYGVTYNNIGSI
jgi:ubiquitin-protein ligase E3 C